MIRIWLWPVVVALVSAFGLVAGLVSEGEGDWLAWLALAVPVVIAIRGLAGGRRAARVARADCSLPERSSSPRDC